MTDLVRYGSQGRSRAMRGAVGIGAVAVMGAAIGAVLGAAAEHRVAVGPPRLPRGSRRAMGPRAVVDRDGTALFV